MEKIPDQYSSGCGFRSEYLQIIIDRISNFWWLWNRIGIGSFGIGGSTDRADGGGGGGGYYGGGTFSSSSIGCDSQGGGGVLVLVELQTVL